ncbi:hypothetical protein DFR24_0101 [Panacagrimonas perspica]|uniref:Uncharacterized protein n=1 Tax=Panacagrimonas perspica TaxID=381431 RepID=A0A4S3K159_9GAMM|nr:hypothetical protein [Panacagrimonas perspica]TDU30747.1 hypothetical protein DFR24_0101 [Panacagrimonas perspica]THD01568.1 hypothetical protein B1810_18815 [Panacagrimonas perspica]
MQTWALVSLGTMAGMVVAILITLAVAWVISRRVPVGPGSMNTRMRRVMPVLIVMGPILLIALSIAGASLAYRVAAHSDPSSAAPLTEPQ